jgi:anti-sigma28 factor (negative regulator of flagellin synthesis)
MGDRHRANSRGVGPLSHIIARAVLGHCGAAEDAPSAVRARLDRVKAVRRGLADGSLVPDPARIARALLARGVL